jgi:3-phenylpropionate/trans-cinnamate dioxygenase ferredoxin subunit
VSATAQWRLLGDSAELDDYLVVPYYLADVQHRVSVARVADTLYAFDDLCPHDRCALSAGLLDGTVIKCQCSGCRFDIVTGAVLQGPATTPLRVYQVRESDGKLSALTGD